MLSFGDLVILSEPAMGGGMTQTQSVVNQQCPPQSGAGTKAIWWGVSAGHSGPAGNSPLEQTIKRVMVAIIARIVG